MFIIFFYKRSSNYWMRSLISWIHLMNVFLESSVFFANIRPSNVQKEFSFFAFFCVFSSLMMDCRNFVRSSVIKMLSLLFLRFFFFIKIEFFTLTVFSKLNYYYEGEWGEDPFQDSGMVFFKAREFGIDHFGIRD